MSTTTASPAVNAATADALRRTYLFVHEHAPVELNQVVDNCRFNTRYAREVLGVLTQAELLTLEPDEGQQTDMWFYNDGVFSRGGLADNAESAEEVIDAWLRDHNLVAPTTATTPNGTTATTPKTPRTRTKAVNGSGLCYCGCGRETKSLFAPGHDARMAGDVAREIVANYEGMTSDRLGEMLSVLPSQALRDKANAFAIRLLDKQSKKPVAKAESIIQAPNNDDVPAENTDPGWQYGAVKIGKNRFAARRNADGEIFRTKHAAKEQITNWLELEYTGTVEGNAAKTFVVAEVQP